MISIRALLLLALLVLAGGCYPVPADGPLGSAAFSRHVKVLADPQLGRSPGSPGWSKAAEYVAAQWRLLGLRPGGADATYFQPFDSAGQSCRNVVGILPASRGGAAAPVIVVGAHYDHLPTIAQRRTAEAAGRTLPVYPGADDNASGVAVLLMLAAALAQEGDRPATFVFVAFDAEESGFNGSRYYVAHAAVPLKRTVLMLNLDQVGRLRGDNLLVIGDVGALPNAKALLGARLRQKGMRAWWVPYVNKRGWSDQSQFASAGVKTIFLYTGTHRQYHTPDDRIETLNVAGAVKIAHYAYFTLLSVSDTAAAKAEKR